MEEPFVGEIELFPYSFAPMNWKLCDGSSLSIAQNSALYSLLGAKFGATSTTFNIPDLRNAAPIANTAYYIALSGLYPTRE